MSFASDTVAPVHPAILQAMAAANDGAEPSYGADSWTSMAKERLRKTFDTDLSAWLVASGTAANALGLSVACSPTSSIICHAEAHIERDERGAPEFFTGGARLSLLSGDHGRIDADTLARRLAANRPDFVHETPAGALSLSNLTEAGTAYRADHIAALADIAHGHGLIVHLDGARFANACAFTGSSPADLTWRAGVDIMSFGVTKNGAAGCEAILLFGDARRLEGDLLARAKRSGHMPPKMRFLGAQMAASLGDGLWLDLARHANAAARDLAEILTTDGRGRLVHPVEGNEVFVELDDAALARLRAAGVAGHAWNDGSTRFVCSWATSAEDLARVTRALKGI